MGRGRKTRGGRGRRGWDSDADDEWDDSFGDGGSHSSRGSDSESEASVEEEDALTIDEWGAEVISAVENATDTRFADYALLQKVFEVMDGMAGQTGYDEDRRDSEDFEADFEIHTAGSGTQGKRIKKEFLSKDAGWRVVDRLVAYVAGVVLGKRDQPGDQDTAGLFHGTLRLIASMGTPSTDSSVWKSLKSVGNAIGALSSEQQLQEWILLLAASLSQILVVGVNQHQDAVDIVSVDTVQVVKDILAGVCGGDASLSNPALGFVRWGCGLLEAVAASSKFRQAHPQCSKDLCSLLLALLKRYADNIDVLEHTFRSLAAWARDTQFCSALFQADGLAITMNIVREFAYDDVILQCAADICGQFLHMPKDTVTSDHACAAGAKEATPIIVEAFVDLQRNPEAHKATVLKPKHFVYMATLLLRGLDSRPFFAHMDSPEVVGLLGLAIADCAEDTTMVQRGSDLLKDLLQYRYSK